MTKKIHIDLSIYISMLTASESQSSGYSGLYMDEAITYLLYAIIDYASSDYIENQDLSPILDTYAEAMFEALDSDEYMPFITNMKLEGIVKLIVAALRDILAPYKLLNQNWVIIDIKRIDSKTDVFVLLLGDN